MVHGGLLLVRALLLITLHAVDKRTENSADDQGGLCHVQNSVGLVQNNDIDN